MSERTLNLTEGFKERGKGHSLYMLRGILGLALLLPSVAVNIGAWTKSLRDISFKQ
jgi:hypothetical protein